MSTLTPKYREPIDIGDGTTETIYPDTSDPACFIGVLDHEDSLVIHAHHRGVHVGTLLSNDDARAFAVEILRRLDHPKR